MQIGDFVAVANAVAGVCEAVAWPIAVFVGFFLVRKPLASLLPELESLKYKDMQLVFAAEARKAKEASVSAKEAVAEAAAYGETAGLADGARDEFTGIGYIDVLALSAWGELRDRDPRDIVVTSWEWAREVLFQAYEVARRLGNPYMLSPWSMPLDRVLQAINEHVSRPMPIKLVSLLLRLEQLRDEVVTKGYPVSREGAYAYLSAAFNAADSLGQVWQELRFRLQGQDGRGNGGTPQQADEG